MKTKTLFVSLIVISFQYCITANINQPPTVVEKTYPTSMFMNRTEDEANQRVNPRNYNPYMGDANTKNPEDEEKFFEELSKQDPNLKEGCKKCNINNKPPGYIDNQENQNDTENVEVVVLDQQNTIQQTADEEIGIASWYGKDFDGRPTASGEIFDSRKLTAAHRNFPLGSIVSVKNLENNKEVVLKINDRGPYVKTRIIDVSEYAAEVLGFKQKGLAKVQVKLLQRGDLKEKGEGATAAFFNRAIADSGSSPIEQIYEEKKQKILKNVINIKDFKHYSVQIGSFTDLKNIIRVKEEIEQKLPYPITIVQKENDYQIRVGRFSERYPAEVLRQKLEEEGYKGFVVSPKLD